MTFKQKAKQKKINVECAIRNAAANAIFWIEEHPKAVIVIVAATSYAIKIITFKNKQEQREYEKQKRDRMVWDPQCGVWWETKTKMTQKDKIEMAELMAEGYNRYEALKIMRKI